MRGLGLQPFRAKQTLSTSFVMPCCQHNLKKTSKHTLTTHRFRSSSQWFLYGYPSVLRQSSHGQKMRRLVHSRMWSMWQAIIHITRGQSRPNWCILGMRWFPNCNVIQSPVATLAINMYYAPRYIIKGVYILTLHSKCVYISYCILFAAVWYWLNITI